MTDHSQTYGKTQPLPAAGAGATTAPLGDYTGPDMASEETPIPTLRVTKRLSLPTGVASNVKQHVVLVRDNSSSMSGGKIRELNQASIALCRELADPANKDGFLVSIVEFSNGANIKTAAQAATTLKVPEARANGGTNFDAALLKTIEAVTALSAAPNTEGWRYMRPHVLFLSDGHSNVSDKNIGALHEVADVTAIAYGSDAAQDTLARIATDGQVHVVGTSGAELRQFLAQVGKTLSQSLATAR